MAPRFVGPPMNRALGFALLLLSACGGESLSLPDSALDGSTDAATDATLPDAGPPDAGDGGGDGGDGGDGDGGAGCQTLTPDEPFVVGTSEGPVRGFRTDAVSAESLAGVDAWLGVPFAAPPVRFAPPQEPSCREEVLETQAFAPVCPQLDGDGSAIGDPDCLYLNVWAPPDARSGDPLPVMFFVHGGANVQGGTSQVQLEALGGIQLYDGASLAERANAVVVTVTYRVNWFGFLAHPDLTDPAGPAGNFGIMDLVRSLQWVHDNVANFGGDPERVLLFGESAGARNTCTLLATPAAAGLFSAALMQSGYCTEQSRAEALSAGATLAAGLECGGYASTEACLRGIDWQTLVESQPEGANGGAAGGAFGATVDGVFLPESPDYAFFHGHQNVVPVIVGANRDEGTVFGAPGLSDDYGVARFRLFVQSLATAYGLTFDELWALYDPANFADNAGDAYRALTAEAQFVCPSLRTARYLEASQSEPVRRYYFTRRIATEDSLGGFIAELGAFHGFELFYLFQHMDHMVGMNPRPADLGLQSAILGYWSRFAASGSPNGGDALDWPESGSTDSHLELGESVRAYGQAFEDTGITSRCAYWSTQLDARVGIVH